MQKYETNEVAFLFIFGEISHCARWRVEKLQQKVGEVTSIFGRGKNFNRLWGKVISWKNSGRNLGSSHQRTDDPQNVTWAGIESITVMDKGWLRSHQRPWQMLFSSFSQAQLAAMQQKAVRQRERNPYPQQGPDDLSAQVAFDNLTTKLSPSRE